MSFKLKNAHFQVGKTTADWDILLAMRRDVGEAWSISIVPPAKNIDTTRIDLSHETMRAIVDAFNLVENLS